MPDGNDPNSIDAPDIGSTPALSSTGIVVPQNPQPQKPPSYFKGIISALGMVLAQGAKAGVAAPRTAQGPAIAAQTAINATRPAMKEKQEDQQFTTQQQMDQLNIAMSQVKLHQLQMASMKMDEDQRNSVYNLGRDTYAKLVERKVATPLADGTIEDVQSLMQQKQKEYNASGGKGLLNLHIAPSVDGDIKQNNGKGKFTLYKIDDGTTEEETPIKISLTDLYDKDDLNKAGLPTTITVPIPAGTKNKDVANLTVKTTHDTLMRAEKVMGDWKKNQANIQSREGEGQKNRGMRLKIAELNDSTKKAISAAKGANDQTDKELISASKGLVTANKALGDAQGKIGNKAWETLGGGEAREIATKRRARDQAQAVFDSVLAKKAAGKAITDLNKPALVPKGTVATRPILLQYLQKAGGDKNKARQMMVNDGYTIPPAQQKAQ